MVARLDMVQDVSQKTLPDRLSAKVVQNGEMLLSIPLTRIFNELPAPTADRPVLLSEL